MLSSKGPFVDIPRPGQPPPLMTRPKMKRLAHFLCVVALLAPALALAQTQDLSARGVLIDRIAAVVNDGVVLKSEVDTQVEPVSARLSAEGPAAPEQVLRQQVLERLVLQEIQLQRAERMGITASDEMLNAALRDMAQRNNIPFAQLPEALAHRARLRGVPRGHAREMTITLLRQRDVVQRINVTPRELEQYIARQAAPPATTRNTTSRTSWCPCPSRPPRPTAGRGEKGRRTSTAARQRARIRASWRSPIPARPRSRAARSAGARAARSRSSLADVVASAEARPGQRARCARPPASTSCGSTSVRGADQQIVCKQLHVRHILMKPNEVRTTRRPRRSCAPCASAS